MSRKTDRSRPATSPLTFAACLRQTFSPALLKQVYRRFGQRREGRWALHPLLLVLLSMTWCAGESQAERFEMARGFVVALNPKRKRPGKTAQGFQMALTRLPCSLLRFVADRVRAGLLARFGSQLDSDGWKVFGCDGSRLRCPRTAELERRLGDPGGGKAKAKAKGKDKVPQVWLTALVHLGSGLPWSWQVGKGNASERNHLARLLPTLPAGALLVADAGYQGDEVYYWPTEARKAKLPPLKVRLLRIRSKGCKHDVWLISSVLAKKELSLATAGKFYRMMWENEGFFRTYKRTLNEVKLSSRKVRGIHREVLGALLALQVLLAQGAQGRLLLGQKQTAGSARQLLLGARREMEALARGKVKAGYLKRAGQCLRERRRRSSGKQKRVWPGRQDHKPPKPPRIRELADDRKVLFDQCLEMASEE